MKIFIVGCAKTGTTLLQRCFFAFKDMFPIMGELTIDQLVEISHPLPIVAKRTIYTIFSNSLPESEIYRQLDLIQGHDIKLIYMTRAKADVLRGNRQTPERYNACVAQSKRYHHKLDLVITYESLTTEPDVVQTSIAEKFGLVPRHKFSSYPDFVPKQVFGFIEDSRYVPRRIGEAV